MNISWEWLTELVDLNNIKPEYLAERLTLAGFEVEDITYNDCNSIVLEISTTANRGDTLGIIGLAREISAVLDRPLISPKSRIPLNIHHQNISDKYSQCSHYMHGIITEIQNYSTPNWLKYRLIASNIKPSNILEDIQNFIYLKWAQHIDFFDLDSLGLDTYDNLNDSLEIISRLENKKFVSKKEEVINEVSSEILTIKTNQQEIAIAGLSTAAQYAAKQNTTNLLVQIAKFDVKAVNAASRILGIYTNNSACHKKNLETIDLIDAYSECIFLITNLCVGKVKHIYYLHQNKYIYPYVNLQTQSIVSTLGRDVIDKNDNESLESLQNLSVTILRKLRFITWIDNQKIIVDIPLDRTKDITRGIDLIEEVSRIYGFDKLSGIIPYHRQYGTKEQKHNRISHLRSILRTNGLNEVVHSSLVENKYMEPIVYNPVVREYNSIRSSLLNNLMGTHSYNLQQGNSALEIFEIGKVFKYKHSQYEEAIHVAGIMGKGINLRSKWQDSLRGLSWFEAKGIMEEIFERLGICVTWQPLDISFDLYKELGSYFSLTSTSTLYCDNQPIGLFGTIELPALKLSLSETSIYAFEILMDKVDYKSTSTHSFHSYAKYPAITRDITITIPETVSFQNVIDEVSIKKNSLVESIDLLNFYRDHKYDNRFKHLGFRIKYRSSSGTLASETIDHIENELKKTINAKFTS